MATILLSILVFGGAATGLAAGILLGRPAPRGSCGGLGCAACGRCRPRQDPP